MSFSSEHALKAHIILCELRSKFDKTTFFYKSTYQIVRVMNIKNDSIILISNTYYKQNMQLFGIDHVLQSLMHCNWL